MDYSILPELEDLKKKGTVRGATGPVVVEAPLTISVQHSYTVPGTTQPVPGLSDLAGGDDRSAVITTAGEANNLQSVFANGCNPDDLSGSSVTAEVMPGQKQSSARGTRGGRNKRKKQAVEDANAGTAAVTGAAAASGQQNGAKHYKPDLQPVTDNIFR